MPTVASTSSGGPLDGLRPSPDAPADGPAGTGAVENGAPWQRRGYDALAALGRLLPGIALAAVLATAATYGAGWIGVGLLGYEKTPISPILLTVLLGLVVRNTVGLPAVYDAGVRVSVERLLRIGVALLGIRLSLVAAGNTGLVALPVVIVCIASALVVIAALARALAIPRRLGTLIAVGTSICGITAIVATAPAIGADDDETSYAVATIALFGTVALFAYPFLARLLFDDPAQVGIFLGTAIHDTSQVAGAGLAYQQQFGAPAALDTAVVTKLVRNLCMVAVIPLLGVLYHRRQMEAGEGREASRPRKLVPLFILGFVAMTALRTLGDLGDRPFGVLAPESWARLVGGVAWTAEISLLLAMAAVGLGTSLRRMRALGFRPFAVGLAAAACVGLVSFTLIRGLVALGTL